MTKAAIVLTSFAVVFAAACGGGGGTSSPPMVTLSASSTSVTVGQSDTLIITSSNASNCMLASPSNSGPVPCNGSFSVTPAVPGSATYTVSASNSNMISGTASISIVVYAALSSIAVIPSSSLLPLGGTETFAASATPAAADPHVTWSIQEGAAGGNVTSAGVYTAPATPGTFHLVATSVADPTKSFSATINVGQAVTGFTATESMNRVVGIHTATLLPNGRVLVAGGSQGYTEDFEEAGQSDAELYDPTTRTFSITGSMTSPRTFHTATLLPSGKVLMAGGFGTGFDQPPALASAELFDPSTAEFAFVAGMNLRRVAHTATLLDDGRVLVAGGGAAGGFGFPGFDPATPTAEIFDPASNAFVSTGAMGTARYGHTATRLPNGQVLIVGGFGSVPIPSSGASTALATAELYDPTSGSFNPTGSMAQPRGGHTATLLSSGKVLVIGGIISISPTPTPDCNPSTTTIVSATAELYDPATGTFTPAGNMTVAREEHTATLLGDGKVLITGGATGPLGVSPLAEIYDPATGTFTAAGSMGVPRAAHTATLLLDGSVLIAGGNSAGGRVDMICVTSLGSAETFVQPPK